MKAILYTSNTGTTKEYATMLGNILDLPVYDIKEVKNLENGDDIIYLGWIMASSVKGYKKIKSKFNVKALVGVGMGGNGSQLKEIREKNKVDESIPVFSLQGGFDINKLHGVYKFMMNTMVKTAGKALANKTDRTKDEEDMYQMMLHGGSKVSKENLTDIINWYHSL
ncbi:MAG: flavodoxin domain-containing protein [Thomasclavelia sp.]|jgi:hypothetical protein|nr:flavodoxin domain-containing protein [Thomasclavelia sp.]